MNLVKVSSLSALLALAAEAAQAFGRTNPIFSKQINGGADAKGSRGLAAWNT
jgi:hypothetical protein